MINVDNKIKNIYYMLCYSFYGELLNEKDEAKLGSEAFDNIYNLFSLLLCLLLKKQIKKGMYKDYDSIFDELNRVKGKLNLNDSIRRNSLVKKKLICEFDEFSENCLLNQIIKTTIYYLIKSNKIGVNTKSELRKVSVYFYNVNIINIKNIHWNALRFNRNNISYRYIVDLCKLVLNGLIVSSEKGNTKFKEFLDDVKLSSIYENFLKAFFKKHYPEFQAKSKILYFSEENNQGIEFIPIMKTDVMLEYNGKKLIIDAKFYSKILRDSIFDRSRKVVNSSNIYQMLAYVDNQDPYKERKAYGMLLYAQTVDEQIINIQRLINGHKIMIRTLDMNSDWNDIKSNLINIAECFKCDSF